VAPRRGDADAPEWFSLAAFGTTGEALAKHAKGDMVAISGRLTKSVWTGRDGAERSGFSVLVDSIASARTVHAKGDMVAISGRLTKSVWTGRDGAERSGFSVLVDSIASARTVRPGKRPERAGAEPFNDKIPF
jgi:single-stranded DNA-binding protein